MLSDLYSRYDNPVPRYTSYPTVPLWSVSPSEQQWSQCVVGTFQEANPGAGISLYVHLPFCEKLCTFCGCHKIITRNHDLALPYIKNVLKEWELYCRIFASTPVIRELHLGGGTPTFLSPSELKLLVEGILSRSRLAECFDFSVEVHPEVTSVEHLKTLRELGFSRLSLGVQDFSPAVQDIINRHQSLQSVVNTTQQARDLGFQSVNFDLIYGLPLQSTESIQQTAKQTCFLKPDRIALYSYAHVPWLKPAQRKFTELDLPTGKSKLDLYLAAKEVLQNGGYAEIGLDHFALCTDSLYQAFEQKKLHRNFMGYTLQRTELLVGLGISAISDSGTAFAQNVKSIDEYEKALSQNMLPIERGHLLSAEDRLVQRHILNIMCFSETSWKTPLDLGAELPKIIERLKPMQQDGLVEITQNGLQVTPLGRSFLRNICQAFDIRYWKSQEKAQAVEGLEKQTPAVFSKSF